MKNLANVSLAVVGLLVLSAGRATASLIVTAPSFSATQGSSGTFDILLQNTGASAVSIGGFSFGISTLDPGISFLSATIATSTDPYIFGTDSLFGPDITISSGTSLTASDNPASVAAYSVAGGATVGLGQISFVVSSGAALGAFAITLSPAITSLADGNGNPIPIDTFNDGTITVTTVTPEPAHLGELCGIMALAVLAARKRLVAR